MTDRENKLQAFLAETEWSGARRAPLAGDASSRRYERLIGPAGSAVLMDAPPSAETPACPPGASVAERKKLGYNAVARLAGPNSGPFVAISDYLNRVGLSAPKILAANLDDGFLVIEDLGDDLFARVVEQGANETELYRAAVDVLAALHEQKAPRDLPVRGRDDYGLGAYDQAALIVEVNLLIDWFWPLAIGEQPAQALRQSYMEAWEEVWPLTQESEPVLVLRDYHAENLLWLPERTGTARVGLIDYQDAVLGARAYDLVSLLEDARRDVPAELAQAMVTYYCERAQASSSTFGGASFRRSYFALGAQRNAKIIGIFARLSERDGKPSYLSLLPRVWRHFERDLDSGEFESLKLWFDQNLPAHLRQVAGPSSDTAHA